MKAFDKLHEIYKTQEAIAAVFKLTRQGVGIWKRKGIPASRALQVEKLTKGQVTALDVLRG
jgi:DNA-binding transcriptional regulator YdaS (Cro superfamily)